MTPEDFQRLKEQEKAHLRQLRDLQQQAADAGRKGRLASALESIAGALSAGDDTRSEVTDRLARDAAHHEARLDLALEAQNEAAQRAAQAAEQARFEQDQAAARARATLDAMKAEMGGAAAPPAAAPVLPAGSKTLGRTPPPQDAPPASADGTPAKTLGRR